MICNAYLLFRIYLSCNVCIVSAVMITLHFWRSIVTAEGVDSVKLNAVCEMTLQLTVTKYKMVRWAVRRD